jgi:hypothetical protein
MGRFSGVAAAALAGIDSEDILAPIRLSVHLSNNKHAYYNQADDRDKNSKIRGNPRLPRSMLARASFV